MQVDDLMCAGVSYLWIYISAAGRQQALKNSFLIVGATQNSECTEADLMHFVVFYQTTVKITYVVRNRQKKRGGGGGETSSVLAGNTKHSDTTCTALQHVRDLIILFSGEEQHRCGQKKADLWG